MTRIQAIIAAVVILVAASATAIAQVVELSGSPDWSTGNVHDKTVDIAMGDIDGDGDLDLACGINNGIYGAANKVWFSSGGVFGPTPWVSLAENPTSAVVLGDVNGDGYLDLVCGNWGAQPAVYLNTGSTLPLHPVKVGQLEYARAVALADMDGDGDLDLICGNNIDAGLPVHVYANDGVGGFGENPVWASADSVPTTAIAVGDLDNNGFLDLVCACGIPGYGARNVAYFNFGGVLRTTPGWYSADSSDTRDVALGDIDGNGYLDVVCGNYASPSTLYLNDGISVDTVSSWSLTDSWLTRSVAVGDVDRDGDLDVAVGNEGFIHDDLVFLNDADTLSSTPSWVSFRPPGGGDKTTSVALADMDGDGDLDLITANDGDSDKLYRNYASYFSDTPDWRGPETETDTWAVELGDIDGDGDLDLVEGNGPVLQKNRLFLFENGTYHPTDWVPVPLALTSDLVLVDLINDGYPDLVTVGNSVNLLDTTTSCYIYPNDGTGLPDEPLVYDGNWEPMFRYIAGIEVAVGRVDADPFPDIVLYDGLYLGNGTGGFWPDPPAWSPEPAHNPRAILMFDADDDGRPEVVRGELEGEVNVFFGDSLTYFTYRPWPSVPHAGAENINQMAAGDVNGDGITDIVCAGNKSNFVLLGDGTGFDPVPVLFGYNPREQSLSVALGDFDADGDLDAVCANAGGGNSIYLGDGAGYADSASWRWPAGVSPADVQVGDIDRDGDLDVVFANDGHANTMYLGRRGPAYRGDPFSPANHRANNAAVLRAVEVVPSGENVYSLAFTAVDVESDPVRLVVEYSFRGSRDWAPLVGVDDTGRFGPYDSSPAGIRHTIPWDVSRLPFSRQETVIRFRVLETPRTVSEFQYAPSYLYTYQRIVPARQEIAIPVDTLSFGTLTLGDTLWMDLPVYNTGTIDLAVNSVSLPSNEMRIDGPNGFTLPPGGGNTVRVMLEPRTETHIAGEIVVYSDDPLNNVRTVYVTTDILPLDVKTRVLTSEPEVPCGDAVAVEVAPLPDVHIQTVRLYHRAAGTASFTDSLVCGWSVDRFLGSIPGDYVTEEDVEFYVRVNNGGVEAVDPAGAPGAFYSIAVAPPIGLETRPRTDPEGRHIAGKPVVIDVLLDRGTVFVDGTVHFREGGTAGDLSVPVLSDGTELTAILPDSAVSARGLEYWAEIHTSTTTLTDPADEPVTTSISIPVTVLDLREPNSHSGMQYRLLSVPLSMDGTITGALTDDFGGPDVTRWRMFAWDGSPYAEIPNDRIFSFEQGRSYWLISKDGHRVDTGPARGVTAPTDRPCEIILQPGGNFIGNPFAFPVAWSMVTADTMLSAVEPPRAWNGGWTLEDVEVLEPFDGYWVRNQFTSPVTIRIPPVEAAATPPAVVATPAGGPGGWLIDITAVCGNESDECTRLGASNASLGAWDRYDRSKPPMPPDRGLSVYFPHGEWERHSGAYAVDMRSSTDDGHVWDFDVAKNFSDESGGDRVVIEFEGIAEIPPETGCVLVDRHLEQDTDLRQASAYIFYLGKRGYVSLARGARFALVVGNKSFIRGALEEMTSIPTRTALYQNRPNPFNPSTLIRYDVSQAGNVDITIYDVTGASVLVLERNFRPPGRYEVRWNGTNARGESVASGVYFCLLRTGGIVKRQKMVLLK